jgi:hypothetical protein
MLGQKIFPTRFLQGCQYFVRQIHTPSQELQTIPVTWPFAVWGLGLLGHFKKAPRGLSHLLVAVDKFTKWVEARPLAKIGSKYAINLVQYIIFHFEVPNSIIIDNDIHFTGEKFLDFCDDNNIRVEWATITHPRTNGHVEHMNGLILQGLKPRILTQEGEDVHAWFSTRAGKWVIEVPSVL